MDLLFVEIHPRIGPQFWIGKSEQDKRTVLLSSNEVAHDSGMFKVLDSPHNRYLWVLFDSGGGGKTTIRTLDYPILQYVQKRI